MSLVCTPSVLSAGFRPSIATQRDSRGEERELWRREVKWRLPVLKPLLLCCLSPVLLNFTCTLDRCVDCVGLYLRLCETFSLVCGDTHLLFPFSSSVNNTHNRDIFDQLLYSRRLQLVCLATATKVLILSVSLWQNWVGIVQIPLSFCDKQTAAKVLECLDYKSSVNNNQVMSLPSVSRFRDCYEKIVKLLLEWSPTLVDPHYFN